MIKVKNGRSSFEGSFLEISADVCVALSHFRKICGERGADPDEEIALAVRLSGMSDEELKENASKAIEEGFLAFAESLMRAMKNHSEEEKA